MEAISQQKILSVDDIRANNLLIQRYLDFDGVEIDTALSGEEAQELISQNNYCLFILDIMMKGMDGFELAEKIREIEKYKHTPIILITAVYSDKQNIFKGYQSGATDYLVKPVLKEILHQKVKIFLELDKQKQDITQQRDILAVSRKRFFDIAVSSADWIWEIDEEGKYSFVSDKVTEVLGYEPLELFGKTPYDLMIPEDLERVKKEFEVIKATRKSFKDLINRNLTKSGEEVCLITNGVPVLDNKMNLIGFRGVNHDITDKIKLESELHFQADLLQNVNDSIIYTDLEGIIRYVNKGTETTFGYTSDDLLTKTLSALYPEQYKDLTLSELFVVIDIKPYEGVWEGTNKDGNLIWLDVKINLMRDSDGKPSGYIIVSKDITDRKKADEEIIRSLITGEDNERKRLASDLHDGLGQVLAASFFNLDSVKSEIQSIPSEKRKQFNSGLGFLNEAIEETRNIAYNLMPKSIENYGLIAPIQSLLKSLKKEDDLKISLSENIKKRRLNPILEVNMYRITQEILNNAIKHAKATRINFQYHLHDNEFIFTYEDNGVGFNVDKAVAAGKGEGLSNIKNRVTSLAGYLSITSKIGKGTSISIEVILTNKILCDK